MEKDFIKRILKDTFPVLAGYFVLGVGFYAGNYCLCGCGNKLCMEEKHHFKHSGRHGCIYVAYQVRFPRLIDKTNIL